MSNVRLPLQAAVIGVIMVAAFQTAPLMAQQQDPKNGKPTRDASPSTMASRAALAETLREKAEVYFAKRSNWAEGARILKQAADLRLPSDPAYVWDMFDAARIFLNARQLRDALQAMAETGSRAFEVGDVRKAAHAYLNAAILARHIGGREEEAMGYVRTAIELAGHRKTLESERNEILARITDGGRKILGEPDWIP